MIGFRFSNIIYYLLLISILLVYVKNSWSQTSNPMEKSYECSRETGVTDVDTSTYSGRFTCKIYYENGTFQVVSGVAVGDLNAVTQIYGNNTGGNSVIIGDQTTKIGSSNKAVAIGNGAVVDVNGGVAIGNGSVSRVRTSAESMPYIPVSASSSQSAAISNTQSTTGAFAVGDADNNNLRQITGVAGGSEDTDAANIAQLKAVSGEAGNQIASIKDTLIKNERSSNAGIASAMSMAGLPNANVPGKRMIALGAANYEGESALAVGVSYFDDDAKWQLKFLGSYNTRGKRGIAVGAGYHW